MIDIYQTNQKLSKLKEKAVKFWGEQVSLSIILYKKKNDNYVKLKISSGVHTESCTQVIHYNQYQKLY